MKDFIWNIPKAELHIHIEGSLEPGMIFSLAERNKINLKYSNVDQLKKAYQFNNLQEFLDLYYQGAAVLLEEEDFYDLTTAYLKKIKEQNVLHTEIFFDPQTHTERGVSFNTVFNGIYKALKDGQNNLGISSEIIMCFLRHLDEKSAFEVLLEAEPYKDKILGVGLDSSELGHPPSKFKNVFKEARKQGYLAFAHAGEEGPAEYVWDAIDNLKISRIDHGNNSLNDKTLTKKIARENLALTVCPLSNQKLKVVPDLKNHPLPQMLEADMIITLNSDDPAYFGGYIAENYLAMHESVNLSKADIINIARNSIDSSFADKARKNEMLTELTSFLK
ncbi:MAG: adenosine deaminase [Melioribacteraceae bacterium]|nr:adenosine deaminase [Melioribacteraceae bacterium]